MTEKYLTPEGKEKLEQELQELVDVKRPDIARRLKEAIADGDLKENANYHDAKEQQALLESRIRDLESTLRSAIVVEENESKDRITIGCEVEVLEEGEEDPEVFRIVGAAEADPERGYISNESPIGAALLNKKKGQKVRVEAPGGEMTFRVKDIR